ncbi:hypothetical protein AMD27_11180 [Acinetobacter sp. TGL-Y2]|uniref:aspartate/glutamate racemase family protein n=1 Tax=Acinetobacter sp. TGL-Y2 TaxID=1407071 RepID=UPI0007A681D8|nr:aspartate/glutamate racemase family protein [Acinetobacter sp. TGL-Y2]AMW79398.1 hypothetical protein AMD27_11180 [Acinetobacter sp. TGL-Y2]
MKTIGLIGGMSWESTDLYYQGLNKGIQSHLGGFHSAQIVLYSVDFHKIEAFQRHQHWTEAGTYLAEIAKKLENAGADVIALCTNTMHKVADQIQHDLSVPFLHIADVTMAEILKYGLTKIALLGTAFTMEQEFYHSRFKQQGIELIVPDESDRQIINQIIYDELCKGVLLNKSKQQYLNIIARAVKAGAQGVILGCTEIGLLIDQQDLNIPVFDTVEIHMSALLEFVLNEAD